MTDSGSDLSPKPVRAAGTAGGGRGRGLGRIREPWRSLLWVASLAGVIVLIAGLDFRAPRRSPPGPATYRTVMAAQAHGIHLALMQYAAAHEGHFPAAEHDANEAFRQLIPEYAENDRPFLSFGSAWHNGRARSGPDGEIGPPPDYPQALEPGENGWAYVSGLTTDSPGDTPLVATAFSDAVGVYHSDPKKRGGPAQGPFAIVVYVNGTVRIEPIDPKTLRAVRSGKAERASENEAGAIPNDGRDIFAPENLPPGARILNPKPAPGR